MTLCSSARSVELQVQRQGDLSPSYVRTVRGAALPSQPGVFEARIDLQVGGWRDELRAPVLLEVLTP